MEKPMGPWSARSTNLPYLFAAYAAVWIGLFGYLLRLERRSRELEEEVRELRRLLER